MLHLHPLFHNFADELFVEQLGQDRRLLDYLRTNPQIAITEMGIDPEILPHLLLAAEERARARAKREDPGPSASRGGDYKDQKAGRFNMKASLEKLFSAFKKKAPPSRPQPHASSSAPKRYSDTPSNASSRESRLSGIEGISSSDTPVASSASSSTRSTQLFSPITNAFTMRSGYNTLDDVHANSAERALQSDTKGFADVPLSPSAEIELASRASNDALLEENVFFGATPERSQRGADEAPIFSSPFAVVDEDEEEADERTTLTGRSQKRHI